jgi:hypothetical protein
MLCAVVSGVGTGPAGAQAPNALADMAFLTGCWAGQTGTVELQEQWTSPDGGLMLGTTRYLRDGEVVDFEFSRIDEHDGVVTLWPYPRGSISERGFPLVSAGREYVFENLEHDFPVRIVYERVSADRLEPRIEGRDGGGSGWALSRVVCPI